MSKAQDIVTDFLTAARTAGFYVLAESEGEIIRVSKQFPKGSPDALEECAAEASKLLNMLGAKGARQESPRGRALQSGQYALKVARVPYRVGRILNRRT